MSRSHLLDPLHEFRFVSKVAAGLPRSPRQRNRIHESDAEILELESGELLAATVDGLHEEYQVGLLRDPGTLGWATVAHSLSDLAAVGADPLGVLFSWELPRGAEDAWCQALSGGAAAALSAHGTFALGGDTSFAEQPAFHCVALGSVRGGPPVSRVGARAGDRLVVTGPIGHGNLLGIARRVDEGLRARLEREYRPRARFEAIAAVRPWVRAAIDTSDGLLSAVDLLARLNGLGVRLSLCDDHYHPVLRQLSGSASFPLWIGGAFGMGEYELLLAIPADSVDRAMAALAAREVPAREVGAFTAEPAITMPLAGRQVAVDTTRLLNLFAESEDVEAYVQGLLAFDAGLRAGP